MSSYTLDYETILHVMRAHKKTGRLCAEARDQRETCSIEVRLSAGEVSSCEVKRESRSLTGNEAAQALERLGRICWTFTPEQTAPPRGLAPPVIPAESLFYPQRRVQTEMWQTHTWPHLHRSVFGLADGTKSIRTIAEVLRVPTEMVNRVLQDFKEIGAITLEQKDTRI